MGSHPVQPLNTGQWVRRLVRRILRKRRTLLVVVAMMKIIYYALRLWQNIDGS